MPYFKKTRSDIAKRMRRLKLGAQADQFHRMRENQTLITTDKPGYKNLAEFLIANKDARRRY